MEEEHHGLLKSGSRIFKGKRHNFICKCAPRGCESFLVLVVFPDLNLIITGKTIHERKYFMASASIIDLVNEQSGEVVFGTCQVQVTEFSIDMNGTLFFVNGNTIGNPSGIRDGVYETYFTQLRDLGFDNMSL